MLPILRVASDGNEHSVTETMDHLANQMGIGEADRDELLPSGTQTRFYNRVTWAITYLSKSLLIQKCGRGRFRIAPRGGDILSKNPTRIDNSFLDQFPEYQSFKTKRAEKAGQMRHDKGDAVAIESANQATVTPDERLEAAYKELREALADDLLERVGEGTPKFFEHLVVDLLVAMGYGGSHADAAQVVGKSGDDGIDGVIKEDRLGLDMVYVQAKKWNSAVGPGDIDKFVGSLMRKKAHKGVFITTGSFTSGALRAAQEASSKIVLIDGEELAELMIDHGVGVTDHKAYRIKRIDSDYFETQ
ncbi:MAG: restriction endonuclease [Tepidisphaeraceae bacterium]